MATAIRLLVAALVAAFLATLFSVPGCTTEPRSALTSQATASFTPWPNLAWRLDVAYAPRSPPATVGETPVVTTSVDGLPPPR